MRFIGVIGLLLFVKVNMVSAQTITYPKVEPNVAYDKVAALTFNKPERTFSYGLHDDQKVLFWSAQASAPSKTVVFIHGGCWLAEYDISHSLALTSALAQNGHNVYSIEYRRAGNGGEWPVAFDDIMLALEAIRDDISEHQNAKVELVIAGHSAGGHLATLAANAASQSMPNSDDYPLFENIQLVGLAPIIDIKAYSKGDNSCQQATPKFMRGALEQRATEYEQANPLNVTLDKVTAHMLIGEQDAIVPLLQAKHPNAEFVSLPEIGHFDWIHPGSDAFTHFLKTIREQ